MKEVVNVKELSESLNISKMTVYRWMKIPGFPYYSGGGIYRFNLQEVLDWMKGNGQLR